ncbi:hypothetical protein [Brevundimonas sp.]|uniref:hypothetical protein n=1 Tax=Brevundimonas sp. TaxID=1871086 RepID=UPI003A8E95A1
MTMLSKITLASPALVGALALSFAAVGPADAQSRYRTHDNDRDQTGDVLIGAAIGALAGALIGNGDGTYVAGGALAGAAIGATSNSNDCSYYRGGQCYRNQGHWEREHGIDRNRDYGYGYGNGYGDYRGYDRAPRRRANCNYYRGGQCYRNQGHWEREHGIDRNRDRNQRYDRRDYRYDRRY